MQAWCREKGIYPHHLTSWKTAFCALGKESVPSGRELRELKDENVKLKRDVTRKLATDGAGAVIQAQSDGSHGATSLNVQLNQSPLLAIKMFVFDIHRKTVPQG